MTIGTPDLTSETNCLWERRLNQLWMCRIVVPLETKFFSHEFETADVLINEKKLKSVKYLVNHNAGKPLIRVAKDLSITYSLAFGA